MQGKHKGAGSHTAVYAVVECCEHDQMFVGTLSSAADNDEWRCSMMIECSDLTLPMKTDTGDDCNVISMDEYQCVSHEPLKPSSKTLCSFFDKKRKADGKASFPLRMMFQQYWGVSPQWLLDW